MTNLLKRTITGFFFVIIILGGILWNQWSFLIIFLLINIFSLREFYTIFKAEIQPNITIYSIATGSIVFLLPSLIVLRIIPKEFSFIIIPLIFLLFVLELFLNRNFTFRNIGIAILGIVYISIPLSLLGYLTVIRGEYSYKLILPLIVFTWINDIFAYLVGKFFGKRKLYERLSPLKTWEGLFGGILATIIASLVIGHFFYSSISLHNWLILSIIVSICAITGDFVESMLKRNFNLKDTGNTLPGHGGFLDRFDALLFVIPFYTTYLLFFII